MESSRRDLSIDMVVDRFILKNNQITLSTCFASHLNHVQGYLKQDLVFAVNLKVFFQQLAIIKWNGMPLLNEIECG